jgi:8-oxo-dGTP diphosphatase
MRRPGNPRRNRSPREPDGFYEGASHWLLFLFRCTKPLDALPEAMDEGRFGFFSRTQIEALPLPETDRTALWQIYDRHRDHFVALRADCAPSKPLEVVIEQITPSPVPHPWRNS